MEKTIQWINVQNTLLVRQMKKPSDDITDTQWSTIKHVLDVMSGFANDEGDNIYPSYKLISEYTALGERTVYRSIAYLLKHKILLKKQSYSLNIPLVIQLATDCQTVVDDLRVDQLLSIGQESLPNRQNQLSIGQESLSIGHINKELITISKKQQQQQPREREGTVVVVLFNKLCSYGFSEEETNSLLTQYGERHIGGNLAYFEVRHSERPIQNIAPWLRKAFSLNWAKVVPQSIPQAIPIAAEAIVSEEPTLDALKGFWISMPRKDRQAAIQEAGIVGRLFIEMLDNSFERDGSGKVDYLKDEFCDHTLFKDLCLYNLSIRYQKSLLAPNLDDFRPSETIEEPVKPLLRESHAKSILEIISQSHNSW